MDTGILIVKLLIDQSTVFYTEVCTKDSVIQFQPLTIYCFFLFPIVEKRHPDLEP